MRIGLVEFLLILAIASLTIGPQVALFVDRWLRRANRVNARAARRRAEYAAQAAAERDALLKRFRTASTVFGVCILLALVYTLVFRPIDTPPQAYDAPAVRQDTGAAQTALATDDKGTLDLGEYQNVDCIRARDGLVYAAACDGAALKKCSSDLVRTLVFSRNEGVVSLSVRAAHMVLPCLCSVRHTCITLAADIDGHRCRTLLGCFYLHVAPCGE